MDVGWTSMYTNNRKSVHMLFSYDHHMFVGDHDMMQREACHAKPIENVCDANRGCVKSIPSFPRVLADDTSLIEGGRFIRVPS